MIVIQKPVEQLLIKQAEINRKLMLGQGTLGRQMNFAFGFQVTENGELSFFERYPAISGYYVIFEKMTIDDLWWSLEAFYANLRI